MNTCHRATLALLLAPALVLGCAAKKSSDPPTLEFDVGFPSEAAAAVTDNVNIFVYEGTSVSCTDLVQLRQTQQPLPAGAIFQSPALSPCQLAQGGGTFSVNLGTTYTMVAVGQIAGADVFVGCAVQDAVGAAVPLSIPLTFIDNKQKLPATGCTKLSDKCSGAC